MGCCLALFVTAKTFHETVSRVQYGSDIEISPSSELPGSDIEIVIIKRDMEIEDTTNTEFEDTETEIEIEDTKTETEIEDTKKEIEDNESYKDWIKL